MTRDPSEGGSPRRRPADGGRPEGRSEQPAADARAAYVAALTMLARRELSEHQIRQRLERKGFEAEHIDSAVARLREERAIDDVRVAQAIARTATTVKRRGKLRVAQEIQRAGISAGVARQAVDAVFDEVDSDGLLEAALDRKLRGGRAVADQREFNRLYRYLAGQGFESDKIVAALRRRRLHGAAPSDDQE